MLYIPSGSVFCTRSNYAGCHNQWDGEFKVFVAVDYTKEKFNHVIQLPTGEHVTISLDWSTWYPMSSKVNMMIETPTTGSMLQISSQHYTIPSHETIWWESAIHSSDLRSVTGQWRPRCLSHALQLGSWNAPPTPSWWQIIWSISFLFVSSVTDRFLSLPWVKRESVPPVITSCILENMWIIYLTNIRETLALISTTNKWNKATLGLICLSRKKGNSLKLVLRTDHFWNHLGICFSITKVFRG